MEQQPQCIKTPSGSWLLTTVIIIVMWTGFLLICWRYPSVSAELFDMTNSNWCGVLSSILVGGIHTVLLYYIGWNYEYPVYVMNKSHIVLHFCMITLCCSLILTERGMFLVYWVVMGVYTGMGVPVELYYAVQDYLRRRRGQQEAWRTRQREVIN